MALQTSGAITISDIKGELGNTSNSLRTLSAAAGFSTPDAMSEFYGYSAFTPPTLTSGPSTGVYAISGTGVVSDPYVCTIYDGSFIDISDPPNYYWLLSGKFTFNPQQNGNYKMRFEVVSGSTNNFGIYSNFADVAYGLSGGGVQSFSYSTSTSGNTLDDAVNAGELNYTFNSVTTSDYFVGQISSLYQDFYDFSVNSIVLNISFELV